MAGNAEQLAREMDFELWYQTVGARWRTLIGVKNHMDKKFGKDNWGDDEFYQYMLERYQQIRDQQARDKDRLVKPQLPLPSDDEIDICVQEYLKFYEEPASPNDMVLLRQMATIESQLENIRRRWSEAIQDGNQSETRTWSSIMKDVTKEHRDIQSLLGIDRISRDKTKGRDDLVEYIRDIIGKAGEFIDQHAIPIRCPKCMDAQSHTEIDMGFILFHFRQDVPWRFEFQCPMCGETIRMP